MRVARRKQVPRKVNLSNDTTSCLNKVYDDNDDDENVDENRGETTSVFG